MNAVTLTGLLAGGLLGYWLAARVGALGLLRMGEGDDMHPAKGACANEDNIGPHIAESPLAPSPRLHYAGSTLDPKEPSAEHLLATLMMERPQHVSEAGLAYLVRCAYRRKAAR